LEVYDVTKEDRIQKKYEEAKQNNTVIDLTDGDNNDKFWNNYGTTFAALSFFDTALSTKYTFQTLPEYVNVEVLMLTRYLQNIFNIAQNDTWEGERKSRFEHFFSIIVKTIRDNKEVLMPNSDILSISEISNQYYTNGNLHGAFNDILQNILTNNGASPFKFNWNTLSKDEVFNKIKNDSRFETVFVMLHEAFQLISENNTLTDELWKNVWDEFWSERLSSLVFEFESNYMNNKIIYTLEKIYKDIKIKLQNMNKYKMMIQTTEGDYANLRQMIETDENKLRKIQDNLRNIQDNLREKHTNIKDYYWSWIELKKQGQTVLSLFFDVKQEVNRCKKQRDKTGNTDAKSCTVMLHNAKTINF